MPTGQVKSFSPQRGYGFIMGQDGQDVFVHYTNIVGNGFRRLNAGDVVSYEAVRSKRGFLAANVRRLTEAEPQPAAAGQPLSACQATPAADG